MSNHPNRGGGTISKTPKPDEIRAARLETGLTQSQAAELLYSGCRKWQAWEGGEQRMHPAFFELFKIKAQGVIAAASS